MACAGSAGGSRPPHEHPIRLPADCEEDFMDDDIEEDPGQAPSQQKKQGERGIAKGLNVRAELRRLEGSKIPLTWDPRFPKVRKAVGKNSSLLDSEISRVVRIRCPPSTENWRRVDGQAKELIWREIEDTFTPVYRSIVLAEASEIFRKWKSKMAIQVKNYLKKGGTWPPPILDETVATQADWEAFLRYIQSEKFKKRSEQNKKNRAKTKYMCSQGRTSMPAIRWKDKNPLEYPLGDDPIQIWAAKHRNSEGQFVNAEAEEDFKRLLEFKERIAHGRRATHEEEEQIFAQALGSRRDYLIGLGPTQPRQLLASQQFDASTSASTQSRDIKFEKIKKSQNRLKKKNKWLTACLKGLFESMKSRDPTIHMPEMPEPSDDDDDDDDDDVDDDDDDDDDVDIDLDLGDDR